VATRGLARRVQARSVHSVSGSTFAFLSSIALLITVSGAAAAAPATGWAISRTPNPSGFNYVYAVGGSAASDVWLGGGGPTGAFSEHFDGTRWTTTPMDTLGSAEADVEAFADIAPNDV
jgi:hypothetical protein